MGRENDVVDFAFESEENGEGQSVRGVEIAAVMVTLALIECGSEVIGEYERGPALAYEAALDCGAGVREAEEYFQQKLVVHIGHE